ncbi:hypothetical protein DI09_110p80 [Mitosporidium daphniae]|uniref:Uncharacterized protein n=1 Tax=Mitosporidium daphniae TaxID=1485682 RepID=A0A098VVD1_9MICR|nr:uncharacterized protein DI09_110p80 [Mitosporidium daphniae]KGG53098.1 hypothetical protein DI09_110p80 [Mitosporidium daphniae]|eukprot:XP_013239534.1 uncharacterized protein DI09_110p80 [Mitosporidium daphniae]
MLSKLDCNRSKEAGALGLDSSVLEMLKNIEKISEACKKHKQKTLYSRKARSALKSYRIAVDMLASGFSQYKTQT